MKNRNLWFNQTGSVVTVAQHCDGGGLTVDLAPGTYKHSEIVSGFNDELSYVNVPAGMKVILYEHARSSANFTEGATLEIVGPKTVDFCAEHTDFNDKMSEIDVIYTGVIGDSDENQDGIDQSEEGEIDFKIGQQGLDYIKEEWNLTGSKAQEIVDYVNDKILKNDTWIMKVEENAALKDRLYHDQLLHEARWMLYRNEPDCKYCEGEDDVVVLPPPPAQSGLAANIPWIIAGVAILGGIYFMMKKK